MRGGKQRVGCRKSESSQSLNGAALLRRSRATAWEPVSASWWRATKTRMRGETGVGRPQRRQRCGGEPAAAGVKGECAETSGKDKPCSGQGCGGPGEKILMPSFRPAPVTTSQ